jgi:hypothetical protein
MKRIHPKLLGTIATLLLVVQSPGILAYCPQAADVTVVPASPSANAPFQIRIISRIQNWMDGSVVATVQGNQILVTGRNGTGPGIPLPEDVAIIQIAGLSGGGYQMVFDIVESTGQVVQCPRFTMPLIVAGGPPQEARAAPTMSLAMLAALLALMLGAGVVAVRRLG